MNRYVGAGTATAENLESAAKQPQHSFGKLGWHTSADDTP